MRGLVRLENTRSIEIKIVTISICFRSFFHVKRRGMRMPSCSCYSVPKELRVESLLETTVVALGNAIEMQVDSTSPSKIAIISVTLRQSMMQQAGGVLQCIC
jgi:hypothetical protein